MPHTYSRLAFDPTYKLLELTPELLSLVESNRQLTFKSSNSDAAVVLCSQDSTFRVRQKNHSNTVLLMNGDEDDKLVAFSSQTSYLEATKMDGSIDIANVPVVNEANASLLSLPIKNLQTAAELLEQSPISESEFSQKWSDLNGCEVDGFACLLAADLLTGILTHIINYIIANNIDDKNVRLSDLTTSGEISPYPPQMLLTGLRRFATLCDVEPFKLDTTKIAQWYGVRALKLRATHTIDQDEFLIQWKSEIPAFYKCPLDISMLHGNFFRPLPGKIQYLNRNGLSMEPLQRFKELFKLSSSWDMTEMKPFLDEINTRNLKLDSFVMKYAKKKSIGKRVVVTSR